MSAASDGRIDERHEEDEDAPSTRFGVFDLVVAIVVGVFFAVGCYIAVGNLLEFPGYVTDDLGEKAAAVPWAPLIAGVAVPPIGFVLGLLLGRGRTSFERTLVLLAAFAASSALGFSAMAVAERMISPG